MFVIFIRTIIIFFFILLVMRLMGKRQVGELQASELVVTILISDIASLPLQDTNTPLSNSLISVLTLVILEILLSLIMTKSYSVRRLVTGKSILIMKNGKINQQAMCSLRLTIDDLLEGLRNSGVFSINDADTVIVETNGKLSILLNKNNQPTTKSDINASKNADTLQVPLIIDGKILSENFSSVNYNMNRLNKTLRNNNMPSAKQIFLFTTDTNNNIVLIKKESKK